MYYVCVDVDVCTWKIQPFCAYFRVLFTISAKKKEYTIAAALVLSYMIAIRVFVYTADKTRGG